MSTGLLGMLADILPSTKVSALESFVGSMADDAETWNAKAAASIADFTIHGSRMAGGALQYQDEEQQLGQWVLVGLSPDGRNCEDCLALHGTQMTYGKFLDMKYTTRCNGNCRCGFDDSGETIEPLTQDEFEDALGARP